MTTAHHDSAHHTDEVSKLSPPVNFICCLPVPLLCKGKKTKPKDDAIYSYFQKSFEWLIGLEEELKIVDPPDIAIEKEIQLVGKQ